MGASFVLRCRRRQGAVGLREEADRSRDISVSRDLNQQILNTSIALYNQTAVDRASFVVSVIKEERRSRQGVVGGLGKEASIVRGKGDDVVEKEWLKPRELGAQRVHTLLSRWFIRCSLSLFRSYGAGGRLVRKAVRRMG